MRRGSLKRHSVAGLCVVLFTGGMVLLPTELAQARECHYFSFVKGTPNDSTLIWHYRDGNGNCSLSASWRSGSGTNTNACDDNDGWLPGGWYDTPFMTQDHQGVIIWGRAWRLTDKYCVGGNTLRDALFIHTEETHENKQDPTDEPHNWDGEGDYYSDGCIKLRHFADTNTTDGISGAHYSWHNKGPNPGHGYYTEGVYVYQP